MPCVFLTNVPEGVGFDQHTVDSLVERLVELTGVDKVEDVEIHLVDFRFRILLHTSQVPNPPNHGVHVFVLWHERPVEVVEAVGKVINAFLYFHDLEDRSDITFFNMPRGRSFVFDGKLVA